jgi:hypothetical protein
MASISTRFLVISDTHNFQFGDAERSGGSFRQPVPKADVLLHCGDLTDYGGLEAYEGVLRMLGSIDAELKLVIAGNHDLDLDSPKHDIPEDHEDHSRALEFMSGPLVKNAGVTYLQEGLNTFTLKNGAKFTIYTSPYQPEFCNMAFPYQRTEDRFNPPKHVAKNVKSITINPIPDFPGIDIMMTHGPPKGILDMVVHGSVGCDALLRAVSRARPRLYCFGHIHEGYGAEVITWKDDNTIIGPDAVENQNLQRNDYPKSSQYSINFGKETLMINAAIMNVSYRPVNAPWLVDLDLPLSE